MTELDGVIDSYLAIWTEVDPVRRQKLIAQAFTEDARHVGPEMEGAGYDGIGAVAQRFGEHFAGYQFRRRDEIDVHHKRLRLAWELLPPGGGARFAAGTDFAELAPDGRLRGVTVFIDQAPGPVENQHE